MIMKMFFRGTPGNRHLITSAVAATGLCFSMASYAGGLVGGFGGGFGGAMNGALGSNMGAMGGAMNTAGGFSRSGFGGGMNGAGAFNATSNSLSRADHTAARGTH